MGITAAVIATVGTVASVDQQRQGARAARRGEEKARKIENKRENIRAQRSKQRLLAQLRVQQAEIEQAGVSAGVQGASSVVGAQGSSATQVASAIGFQNTLTAANTGAAGARARGARQAGGAQNRAALFGATASIAGLFAQPKRNEALFGTNTSGTK